MEQKKESAPVKVIFLDRDGTMNEEVHYLYRTGDLKLLPGVAEAVGRLNRAGYRIVVVTNQAGVARGYYTEEDVLRLHEYLNCRLKEQGAHVDSFYYCPHHPEHGIGEYRKECLCRKPGTGMFEQACEDLGGAVDKESSYMVGDKLLDAQAGHNFGIKSILVGTGYGKETRRQQEEKGQIGTDGRCLDASYEEYAADLTEAVSIILKDRG